MPRSHTQPQPASTSPPPPKVKDQALDHARAARRSRARHQPEPVIPSTEPAVVPPRRTAHLYGKAYSTSRSHYSLPFASIGNTTPAEVEAIIAGWQQEGRGLYDRSCIAIEWD